MMVGELRMFGVISDFHLGFEDYIHNALGSQRVCFFSDGLTADRSVGVPPASAMEQHAGGKF
jgi:hypothetical protein